MTGSPEESMNVKIFREAFWKLMGKPTQKDKLDTIVTDITHVMEDAETLRQSVEELRNDLLELWKENNEDEENKGAGPQECRYPSPAQEGEI